MLESDRDRAARGLDRELGNGSPGRDLLDELFEVLPQYGYRLPETAGQDEPEALSREVELSDDGLDGPDELARGIVDDGLGLAVAEVRRLLHQGSERGDLFAGELAIDAVNESLDVFDVLTLDRRGFSAYRSSRGKAFRLVLDRAEPEG